MKDKMEIPISTKWLIDSVGETGRNLIINIFMIICPKANSKGTGFLYKSGHMITNWHVVKDCPANEIVAISCNNEQIKFTKVITDEGKDLALLTPDKKLNGGLEFDNSGEIKPGIQISTWGYPLGYNGPAPLLSVGYISGFKVHNLSLTVCPLFLL
jgi:S1-C subfamily serine protease